MRHASLLVLPDPPRIPVAGRPDQDILREVTEEETFSPAVGRFCHDLILTRKKEENINKTGAYEPSNIQERGRKVFNYLFL